MRRPSRNGACVLCGLWAALLASLTAGGCGWGGPSEKVLEARRLFQQREVQQALDALEGEESPEGRYLKSLALFYLQNHDAAKGEIKRAREADPENVKYRGFELRMRLAEGKIEVVDELIELCAEHPASGAMGLFGFWAHGTKRIWHLRHDRQSGVRESSEQALESLRTGIALSAEVPELQRELLELALEFRLHDEIVTLVETLREIDPDDPDLWMAAGPKIAIDEARHRYDTQGETESAALVYAAALLQADATKERDREFARLMKKHGKNTAILSLYAVYLARSSRLAEASKLLDAGVERQTRPGPKKHLMRIAVYLPLERGEADLAQEHLDRYRDQLDDPLLIEYFEGRILFLRNQHAAAIDKLRRVVQAESAVVGSSRRLAAETLAWINRIYADETIIRRLRQAAESIKPTDNPAPSSPAESDARTQPTVAPQPVDGVNTSR